MIKLIDLEKARDAIQTKYTRTVASNGILPVTWSWTTQAGLNALLNKTTEVFIGNFGCTNNDTDATNTLLLTLLDFSAAALVTLNRTNMNYAAGQSLLNFYTLNVFEFSDMVITPTGSVVTYCIAQGYKFTFS